jgi:hypothetical protein
MFVRLMSSMLCAAILSACAGAGQGSGASAKGPATIGGAMAQADAAVLAGQSDKAYAILKGAGSAFPTDKQPWLRMAQMRYDSNNYGEAIVAALEALSRDPDDTLANSIVAVSGLRVSSKALADLSLKNNLSGSVRSEAQDLARLLRTSLGEEVLVPSARATRREAPRRPASASPPRASASASASASSDPFGALK